MIEAQLTVAQRIQREALDRYSEAVNRNTDTAPQALGMVKAGEHLVHETQRATREAVRDALTKAGVI